MKSRRKIKKRQSKPMTEYQLYKRLANEAGLSGDEILDESSFLNTIAANNEKIRYGYRKRGDLRVGAATIVRYQIQGEHTDEQIEAMLRAYNKRNEAVTKEDFLKRKLYNNVIDEAKHYYNQKKNELRVEFFKNNPFATDKEWKAYFKNTGLAYVWQQQISNQIYGSP